MAGGASADDGLAEDGIGLGGGATAHDGLDGEGTG